MSEGLQPGFWDRTKSGWHAAEYAVLVVLALMFLVTAGLTTRDRVLGLVLLAAVGLAYALAGRRALFVDRTGLALAYLVPAWASFLVLTQLMGASFLMLLVLLPQSWAMLTTRGAVVANVVGLTGLVVVETLGGNSLRDALITGVVNLALSLLLGFWVTGIVNESDRRAELIRQLERTRAELAEAEHSRGVLAERARLAGEIHDTLAQGFTSIVALSQAAEAVVGSDEARARDRLAMIERTARDNLAEARALVAALGPVDLEDASLADALRRLAGRVSAEVGVPVEVAVEGASRPLSPDREVVLLRAAQEALANVRKHAAASHVRLLLHYAGTGATVEVADDGRGFDPAAAEGFGLRGMESRAAAVGGRLRVDSAPGRGTVVALSVP